MSASRQALQISCYLSRPTLRSIQTMLLISYFLMNDNHASDAWAFSGIMVRQAYALGLNRDPSKVVPDADAFEMQQRRKIWQAVFMQDTFLTVILELPPTTYQYDVRIEDLFEEEGSIAISGGTDISYIRSMWILASIVQSKISKPRSLKNPICASAFERSELISSFNQIYTSFPLTFRTFTEAAICDLARRSRRLTRQTLFLTSNYFHCMMLIHADENEELSVDVKGTLDAAHVAVNAYFLLHTLFEDEARVWYHAQHRAFIETVRLPPTPTYSSRPVKGQSYLKRGVKLSTKCTAN